MTLSTVLERPLTASVFILLAGLSALGALSTNIILPAFPGIAAELGVTSTRLSATLSSFFIAFAVGQLVVGPLSDRFGRKPLVAGGLILFFIGSGLCALATDLPHLIAARVIQALGVCCAAVLSRAIARDLYDGDALTRTLSLMMVATAAAPGFSPLLGGALDSLIGWRGIFWSVGVIGLGFAFYYLSSAGETLPAAQRSPASLRHVLSTYLQLGCEARFIIPAMAVSLVLGGLFAYFASAPVILLEAMGLSPLRFGLFFASTVLVVFAAGLAAPHLAKRFGPHATALVGIGLALVGSLLILRTAANPTFWVFSLSTLVFLMGMGLINPIGTALALQPFARQAGAASALLGFLQMATAAIAISLIGGLALSPVAALGLILCANCTLALLLFAVWLRRKRALRP